MLEYEKLALENLRIRKHPVTLATSKFQKLFINTVDLKPSWFEIESCFLKKFNTKKKLEWEHKSPSSVQNRVKGNNCNAGLKQFIWIFLE